MRELLDLTGKFLMAGCHNIVFHVSAIFRLSRPSCLTAKIFLRPGRECPLIGLAKAIANAIFDAAGVRLHSLPLVPNGLKVA
jgi:hypothetical protein